MLQSGTERSALIDALSFVAFLVGVCTPLAWLLGGLRLALAALACAAACLPARRTRPIGAWSLLGLLLGTALIGLLAAMLALSGPMFGEG